MIISSRRELVGAALSMPLALADPSSKASLLDLIVNYTPAEFRSAVARTGRFLYRGEGSLDTFQILAPEPDLLTPGTYDNAGLAYFRCLEKRLRARKVDAIPSKGHIATSDVTEASQWGEAVSIWPLGTSFSYVWPRQTSVLYPPSAPCPSDELAINQDLEMALKLGHEVLFESRFEGPEEIGTLSEHRLKSTFLAVPSKYEEDLKVAIKEKRFL